MCASLILFRLRRFLLAVYMNSFGVRPIDMEKTGLILIAVRRYIGLGVKAKNRKKERIERDQERNMKGVTDSVIGGNGRGDGRPLWAPTMAVLFSSPPPPQPAVNRACSKNRHGRGVISPPFFFSLPYLSCVTIYHCDLGFCPTGLWYRRRWKHGIVRRCMCTSSLSLEHFTTTV